MNVARTGGDIKRDNAINYTAELREFKCRGVETDKEFLPKSDQS